MASAALVEVMSGAMDENHFCRALTTVTSLLCRIWSSGKKIPLDGSRERILGDKLICKPSYSFLGWLRLEPWTETTLAGHWQIRKICAEFESTGKTFPLDGSREQIQGDQRFFKTMPQIAGCRIGG